MKTRSGFVSNSSSSSFIVHDPKRTTAQIMRNMLVILKKEHKEKGYDIKKLTKIIKWLKFNSEMDKPLLYPYTCNYETWVYKSKNKIDTLIDTCNNEDGDWSSMDYNFKHKDNELSEEDWEYMKTLKFLDLTDMKEKTYKEFSDALYPQLKK
jgi:hypothetical protein